MATGYAANALRLDPMNSEARLLMDTIQQTISSEDGEEEEQSGPGPASSSALPPASSAPPSSSSIQLPVSSSSSSTLAAQTEPASPLKRLASNSAPPPIPDSNSDAVFREQESQRKKNDGNEAMKTNNFNLAIQLYTEAIVLDSTNMMFFNNRAQAYLKLGDFSNAEKDSTVVIESNARLPNLKALYRRALARKGINTRTSLQGALEDLTIILNAEPANKEAKNERSRIHTQLTSLINEERAATAAKQAELTRVKQQIGQSAGVVDDGSGLVARSTRVKTADITAVSSSSLHQPHFTAADEKNKTGQPVIPPPSSPATSKTLYAHTPLGSPAPIGSPAPASPAPKPSPSPSTHSSNASPGAIKRVIVKNPAVPTEAPKTVYELERVWRGLKNHPDLFADYLKIFKKSTFKKVIKEAVSPDLLGSMLVSVREHLLRHDAEAAFTVLEGLASTPKFSMTLSILPAEDLECIRSCIDHLSTHVDPQRAIRLRPLYQM
jgi:RNA polymerase II-associated protein 3